MLNILKFEDFINESSFMLDDVKKTILSSVNSKLKNKIKSADFDPKNKERGEYVIIDTDKLQNLVDDSILKSIKSFNNLKVQGLKGWLEYNKGYGGIRCSYDRHIVNTEGDGILELKFGWSSGDLYDENHMPYPVSYFLHLYPRVIFHYGSISVGHGTSSEIIKKISKEDIEDIKINIFKSISKEFLTCIKN